MSFPEASSGSVHLVSKGAWIFQKTNKKCGKSFRWYQFKKKRPKTSKNVSMPSQKTIQKNQSAQIEGANLPRTYKSFKYRFSIYKTRSEEFESILQCKRRACGEAFGSPALGAPRIPPALILSGPRAQHGDSRRGQGKKGNVSSGEVFDDEYSSMKGPFCPFTVATRDCSRHGPRSTGQLRGEAPADFGAGRRVGGEWAARAGPARAPAGCTGERGRRHAGMT